MLTQQQAIALTLAGVAGAVAFAMRESMDGDAFDLAPNDDQTAGEFDDLMTWGNPLNLYDDMTTTSNTSNRAAFLAMIRYSEGTDKSGGYCALFGWPAAGRSFSNTADHPRVFFTYVDKAGKSLRTSAAGAYQITATTFNGLQAKAARAGFPGFDTRAQDWLALELIRERGALADIDAGRFADAVAKVRKVWASLPGAGYNQPERSLQAVQMAYQRAGGIVATA
jgi:lysozyme